MWTALSMASFTNIASSECEWMSMNPGAIARPSASITRASPFRSTRPTRAIRSPATSTSAANGGRPVPS